MTPNETPNENARTKTPAFEDDFRVLVRAHYPVVWIQTHEEERVLRIVSKVASDGAIPVRPVFVWSRSKGMESVKATKDGGYVRDTDDGELIDPIAALNKVMSDAETAPARIFILRDLHRFFNEADATYRFLRDAAHALRTSKTTLVVTAPVANLPVECEKDVVVVDLPLPTAEELRARLEATFVGLDAKVERPKNGTVEKVIKAGLGLTEDEFADAVKESIVRVGKADPKVIVKQKEQVIRKSGVVELYQTVESLDNVGGLDLLREWIQTRSLAFSDKAAKFGLRAPKGLFLTGPPGTGKTLTAKAAASFLNVPLLRLKGEGVFSKFVGESEQNLARVLKLADTVSPCVLFIDECEKFVAGSSGSESGGDSGVSRRVFGALLQWMADHTTPVLVVATANDPLGIPPEMMSRFDSVFFVDLPTVAERVEILRIHLERVGRKAASYDLESIAAMFEGYSGREIEKVLNEALFRAFSAGAELSAEHFRAALATVLPLATTRKAEIDAMRSWSRTNAIPASKAAYASRKQAVVEVE